MPRHKHADQMIKLANNSDAVVWVKTEVSKWTKLGWTPGWEEEHEYRTILPEFSDLWQAFLDGELEFKSSHKSEWEKWTTEQDPNFVPNFDSSIECYRRTPSGEESSPDESPEKADPQFRPCPEHDSRCRKLKAHEQIKVGDFFYALDRYDRLRLVEVLETTLTSSCFSFADEISGYLIQRRVPPRAQIYRKV